MDPESALGQLLQAAMLVGAGSTRLNTTPIVPGMKTEFPGPPPVYDGHGFGPPVILDLSPRGVDHLPSIQSPYTPGNKTKKTCPLQNSVGIRFNNSFRGTWDAGGGAACRDMKQAKKILSVTNTLWSRRATRSKFT